MSDAQPAGSHLTTIVGGAGVLLASLILLLASLGAVIPISDAYIFPFRSQVPSTVSAIIFLVALAVLAFGIRGEQGIVGGSIVGKVAMLVFGIGGVVTRIIGLLSDNTTLTGAIAVGYLLTAISAIVLIASIVAAIVIARAGVLHGFARWALLVLVAWDLLMTALFSAPLIQVAYVLAVWHVDVIRPLLLIAVGVAYLLHGQTAAIRHRLHIINEKW